MIQIDMTFVASMVNFLLLATLLTFFLYRPVRRFMADRQERIGQALEEAARDRAESARARREYEARLAQANQEAMSVIEDATVQAEKAAAELLDQARKEARNLLDQAAAEAKRERAAAFEAMRDQVVDLAISIAGKVAERHIGSSDDEAIVRRLIQEGGLAGMGEREQ